MTDNNVVDFRAAKKRRGDSDDETILDDTVHNELRNLLNEGYRLADCDWNEPALTEVRGTIDVVLVSPDATEADMAKVWELFQALRKSVGTDDVDRAYEAFCASTAGLEYHQAYVAASFRQNLAR